MENPKSTRQYLYLSFIVDAEMEIHTHSATGKMNRIRIFLMLLKPFFMGFVNKPDTNP